MSAVDQTHYSIFTVGAGNLFIGLMIAIGCWMLNIRISRDRIDLHSSGHLLVQPKIYLYRHPVQSEYLINYECPKDMYYMESLLPRLIVTSPFHAIDPKSANLFLIPHESTCLYHRCLQMRYENNPDICKLEAGRYMAAIISYITSVYPYFNQTQGIDHVIVQTWDQSSEVYGWNSDSWRLLNKNLIRLSTLGYAGIHVNFNVYKDIVIPPYINFDDIESWLSNLSDTHNESDQLLGRRSMAYFRGTIIRDFAYSHGVRQYISQNLSEKYLHDPRRYQIYEGHTTLGTYITELRNSLFVLCPSGWSPWSPRIFESIIVGSIPIIFSDDLRLPFEDVIDYRAFVVKIFDKNIAELDGLLDRLVDQKLRNLERLKHMKAVREAFWWRPTYKDNLLNPLRLVMQELASKIRRRPIGNMEIIQIES